MRFGFLPGVSYWFSHTPGTIGNRPRNDNNRQIISGLADRAGVVSPVVVSRTRVEAPIMLAPDKKAAVVTLLNYGPGLPVAPIRNLSVSVALPFTPTAVQSVQHGDLQFTTTNEQGRMWNVSFSVPLEYADFVKFL